MKKISKFVNFKFKNPNRLGRKNKAKISRAFNFKRKHRNLQFIKTANKQQKANVKELFQETGRQPGTFKGVFVSGELVKGRKIRFKNNVPLIEGRFETIQKFIRFPTFLFAIEDDIELYDALDALIPNINPKKGQRYRFVASNHIGPSQADKDKFIESIIFRIFEYVDQHAAILWLQGFYIVKLKNF